MGCYPIKVRRPVFWFHPPIGALKSNVDGASRSKLGLTGIRGVLHNSMGKVLVIFSKYVRICDSHEVEVLAV